jgi:transposase, IS30 family
MAHKHLSYYERCKIQVLDEEGYDQKYIAQTLGRAPSTISREFKRNKTHRLSRVRGWLYRGDYAQDEADERRKNKPKNIKFTDDIKQFVREKLALKWSPEQITGYAKVNSISCVSHECIYQFVLADKKAGGKLYLNLRQGHKKYRRRYGSGKRPSPIKNKVSIDLRPEVINNKSRLGDWEIDTVVGKGRKSNIVTVAERVSRKFVFKKVTTKAADIVANATINLLKPYEEFVHSVTADNGTEFAAHESISRGLESEFYFAHPYSSWERGLNENCNGLLRQYLPKGSDFANVTAEQLQAIEDEINNRPRKTLNFKTPNQVFKELAMQ